MNHFEAEKGYIGCGNGYFWNININKLAREYGQTPVM